MQRKRIQTSLLSKDIIGTNHSGYVWLIADQFNWSHRKRGEAIDIQKSKEHKKKAFLGYALREYLTANNLEVVNS